jgi:hypothetical protein
VSACRARGVQNSLGEHDDADVGVVRADPLRGVDASMVWVGGILRDLGWSTTVAAALLQATSLPFLVTAE